MIRIKCYDNETHLKFNDDEYLILNEAEPKINARKFVSFLRDKFNHTRICYDNELENTRRFNTGAFFKREEFVLTINQSNNKIEVNSLRTIYNKFKNIHSRLVDKLPSGKINIAKLELEQFNGPSLEIPRIRLVLRIEDEYV